MRYSDLISENVLALYDSLDILHENAVPSLTDDILKDFFKGRKDILAKLFANRELSEGTMVTVRLNLNSQFNMGGRMLMLQTVHKGKSPKGVALGYDLMVTLKDAEFVVHQGARAQIAKGLSSKFPMAGVAGRYSHAEHKLDGVEIRFNPRNEHLFTTVSEGYAVKSASEVTIFNSRVYARGSIEYWDEADAPKPTDDVPSNAKFMKI